MRIANWNVRALYRAGGVNEVVKGMGKHKAGAYVLQEIRRPGKVNVRKKIII